MAKKTSTKVSAGTTANPAPTAAAAPASPAASSPTPEAAPAPAAPRRPTTAGSPRPATAQAATENDQATLTAQLAAMLGGSVTGEDDDTTTAAPAPTGDTQAADDASSNTPEDDATTAEDSEQHTGEEAADDATASGEPEEDELAESQAEDDADDDALEALAAAKKWPKSYLRRLQRERKARIRTESDLESLRAEVAALKTGRNAPAGAESADNAAPVTDEETRLAREAEQLQRTLRTLARNRDGMTITVDGQPRELSADDVEEYRENYRRQLAKADLKLENLREQRAQQTQALEGELLKRHPWMRDKADPGRSMVEAALRQYPALAAVPEMRLVLANNVAYQRLLERAAKGPASNASAANGNGQANGNGHPAPAPPPRTAPRTAGRPAAAPVPSRGDRSSMQAAIKKFNETGNPDDGKILVSALLE